MTRISITGSSGFVGRNLIPFLNDRKIIIDVISREKLRTVNAQSFDDIDVIIHLAGKAHDLSRVSDSSEYYKVNFELTKNLYEKFLDSDVKKFIFISSVKAAADTIDNILTEDYKPQPQTAYGKSKLMAEEYIQSQILPAGKSYYILRPCMIHGPGNKGNLNLLYKIVKKGMPYPFGAFDNARSFLSIDNLSFIIERLISDPSISSGIYNLADDDPISTNELIQIISSALGKSPKIWKLNASFVYTLAVIGDKLHLPLNSERLKKLTESYMVDNSKLKQVLNIRKLPVSSQDGLLRTIQSFL